MIHYSFVVRNHVNRDRISNICDISNFKANFLSKKNFKAIVKITKQHKEISKKKRRQVTNELSETEIYKFSNSAANDTRPSTQHNTTHNTSSNTPNNNTRDEIQRHQNKPPVFKLRRNHRDRLFWTIYVLHHGFMEYHKIHLHYGNVYLQERLEIAQYLDTNTDLKSFNHKITKATMEEIRSELVCPEYKTSFHALCALCCYYKFKIILIHEEKKYFIEFFNTVGYERVHILSQDKHDYHIIHEDATEDQIEQCTKNKIPYVHYTKPMKGMSSYKVDDLRKKAQLLNIDKNKTKLELYENIYRYIG